jgi:flagellar protein FlbD
MITVHRLGHSSEPLYLSPDLIVTVEANPDTVVTLTTGAKMLVEESADEIARRVQEARVSVLVDALDERGGVPRGPAQRDARRPLRSLAAPAQSDR